MIKARHIKTFEGQVYKPLADACDKMDADDPKKKNLEAKRDFFAELLAGMKESFAVEVYREEMVDAGMKGLEKMRILKDGTVRQSLMKEQADYLTETLYGFLRANIESK